MPDNLGVIERSGAPHDRTVRKTFTFLLCAVALQVAANSKALTAAGVKAANAAIATSEVIEANEKMVNEIYLSTVAKDIDGFSADQVADLFDMANQCPLIGGNAVYRARALYALIDNEQDFDDLALCLPFGIEIRSADQTNDRAASVIPNPTDDLATLIYRLDDGASGSLVLYDAIGKEVARHSLTSNEPRFHFSTAELNPGAYHFIIQSGYRFVGDGKLVIVR